MNAKEAFFSLNLMEGLIEVKHLIASHFCSQVDNVSTNHRSVDLDGSKRKHLPMDAPFSRKSQERFAVVRMNSYTCKNTHRSLVQLVHQADLEAPLL
jgi:hypothetical protein